MKKLPEYGEMYNIVGSLIGPNGRVLRVASIWTEPLRFEVWSIEADRLYVVDDKGKIDKNLAYHKLTRNRERLIFH